MERYHMWANGGIVQADPRPNGVWVRYEDAQRAVAEAEQRGREDSVAEAAVIESDAARTKWYEQGQRDERAKHRRILTADDPEPAVGAVVRAVGHPDAAEPNTSEIAVHRHDGWYIPGLHVCFRWHNLFIGWESITLIHDAGGES